MKKLALFLAVMAAFSLGVFAEEQECTTIQEGELLTSDGRTIETGYDMWGYNYQAHMFKGDYCGAYMNAAWCMPYVGTDLIMKWNDAWLSNKDCDGDGKLDRHNGFDSYIGSGAWETNHMFGEYEQDGKTCKWEYFAKIVAKPTAEYDCEDHGGYQIWGEFCTVFELTNDPCAGMHGVDIKADIPGFGYY